jgi:hypothetical protein
MNEIASEAGEEDLEQHVSRASDPNWSVAKILAVVLGAPLVAFAIGALCVARLPLPPAHAFAWGLHVMVPLWIALASALPLVRRGELALGACLAVSASCGLVLWLGGAS